MSRAFYRVIHETSYVYETRVAVAQQLLHLTPRELAGQRLLAHSIVIDPQPSEKTEHLDYFGNPVSYLVLAAPHDALTVRTESDVELDSRGGAAALPGSPDWESVCARLQAPDEPVVLEAAEFVFESPHVRTSSELADYASPSFFAGRPLLDGVLDLNHRINTEFLFDPAATTVATPLSEVLKLRRGVCQDFAHLMIGSLRALGLSARYVSGYILTTPPPGQPRLVGADASHAWVSVFCPGTGWIDFDPTNDLVLDDEHITLAWGRDFSDVVPMRGVILGGGSQELNVRVTVLPMEPPQVQWQQQNQGAPLP